MSTEVVIKAKELPNKYLPKAILDTAVSNVGSHFQGKGPLRGLNPEEEKKYLPKLLGIDPDTREFEKAAIAFWAEMRLQVPSLEGKVLDISTDSEGEPNNLEDWIAFQWLKKHKKVAKNEAEMRKDPMKEFYIYDAGEYTQEMNKKLRAKMNAQTEFIKLMSGTSDSDKAKFDLVYRVLVGNPDNATREEKENRLSLEVDNNPEKFYATVKDKGLETRGFIDELLEENVLRKVGNHIFFVDDPLGATMEEAIAHLNSTKNSSTLTTLKARLADAKANR